MKSLNFKKLNVNPEGKKVGDCVIRAISTASDISWLEAYDKLNEVGRKQYAPCDSKETYEKYLLDNGWTKHKKPFKETSRGRKTYDAKTFVKSDLYDSNLNYIIRQANHLTCIVNYELIDSWDCSDRSIYNYYTKKIK